MDSKHQGKESNSSSDLRLYAYSLRIQLEQTILPQDAAYASSYTFPKKGKETQFTLTILTQPHTHGIRGFFLIGPDRSVGITGIWHHGIEEMVYVQEEQGERICRSFRRLQDDIIEQGFCWLSSLLPLWTEKEVILPLSDQRYCRSASTR